MSLLALALLGADTAAAGQPSLQLSTGLAYIDPENIADSSWTILPRAGYYFTDRIGIEAGVGMVPTTTNSSENISFRGATPRLELVTVPFTAGRFALLAAAGPGMSFYSYEIEQDDDDTIYVESGRDIIATVGPSARYDLTDALSLRADLRVIPAFEGVTSFEFTAGLQFRPGPRDRDGDGLVDRDDACPTDPEDFDQFEDTDGCPDLDNDRDGIVDTSDTCPNDPEDADGFEDFDGCPDLDNDQDTVADTVDDCPDEYGEVETAGCPVVAEPLHIDARIHFETNLASLRGEARSSLTRIAELLNAHPEITQVEIAGHADERGSKAHNLTLSQRRAGAVVRFLVSQGIDGDRLTARGYGEDVPVGASDDDNRRVEFRIIEQATSARQVPSGADEG